MKSGHAFAGLLLLIIIQSSWQVAPDQDTDRNSILLTENSMLNEPLELPNMKRHSEGTFSNDYSKYLETRRAQDFVQWLKNSKRNGGLFRRHADGTYTSDVSSYLQDQAAKEFVSWLKTGRGRRDWTQPEHHSQLLPFSKINATLLTDSVPLCVSQSVLDLLLVMLLNSTHKKPCQPSAVEGNVVQVQKVTVCLKCISIINAVWIFIKCSRHLFFHTLAFYLLFHINLS